MMKHLDEVNETYFEHMGHALRFSWKMAYGSLACLIHAVFPFLCVKTGSNMIANINNDMANR
jgi:hypothetical protein